MGILRSFGLFIFLLTVLVLMPAVFGELTRTLVVFLRSAQEAFAAAGVLAAYAGHLPVR